MGLPELDVGEFDCGPRAAVLIEPGLRRQSLQNGNIRGCGWRLSPIARPRLPTWEHGDEVERAKSRHFRPILAFPGEPGGTPEWVGWRRSADRTFLQLNSLLSGNLTGNFVYFEHPRDLSGAKPAVRRALFKQFPGLVNRENYSRIREISRRNRERDQQLRPRSTVQRRTSCSSTPLRAAVIGNQKAPGAFN
jgi:hypothetical protein